MAQQNLDFNIIAHTKGMEAVAQLINRVGALEAETKRLASANATLSNSTETVIRNGVRYNNMMDAQSKQLRQNRQGTQQLGMQVNDFFTSVSSGTSIQQAFAQQLGQVGYAMSMMEGNAGRVGAFLAGPWGGLITVASLALGYLAEKFIFTGESAKKMIDVEKELADSSIAILDARAELDKALGRNTNNYLKARLAAVNAAQAELQSAMAASNAAQVRMQAAAQEAQFLNNLQKRMAAAGGQYGGALGYLFKKGAGFTGYGDVEGAIQDANVKTVDLQKATAKLLSATAGLRSAMNGEGRDKGGESPGSKKKKVEDLSQVNIIERNQAAVRDALARGNKYWQDYYNGIAPVAESTINTLLDINEMATASVQTVGETAGRIFLDRATEIQNAFANVGMAVNNAFKGMLTGAMSWKDGMRGIISAVIDELWRLYVVQQIVGFVTKTIGGGGGGGMPSVAGAASSVSSQLNSSSFFGPGFANGTVNAPGGMALVGERGPEIVNLPRGAQVIPTHRSRGMMGGGINVNVDARGSSDPAAVRAQVQQGILEAAPAIIAAAQARTVTSLRRPRLGGAMQ